VNRGIQLMKARIKLSVFKFIVVYLVGFWLTSCQAGGPQTCPVTESVLATPPEDQTGSVVPEEGYYSTNIPTEGCWRLACRLLTVN